MGVGYLLSEQLSSPVGFVGLASLGDDERHGGGGLVSSVDPGYVSEQKMRLAGY